MTFIRGASCDGCENTRKICSLVQTHFDVETWHYQLESVFNLIYLKGSKLSPPPLTTRFNLKYCVSDNKKTLVSLPFLSRDIMMNFQRITLRKPFSSSSWGEDKRLNQSEFEEDKLCLLHCLKFLLFVQWDVFGSIKLAKEAILHAFFRRRFFFRRSCRWTLL